jgi:hypothetical protein
MERAEEDDRGGGFTFGGMVWDLDRCGSDILRRISGARLYLVDEIAEPSRDRLKNGRCFVAIAGFLLFIPEIVHQLAIEVVHFEG